METYAKYKADHEVSRSKVCTVCGSKIVSGSQPLSKFMISKDVESLIKKYSNEDFAVINKRFPKSV